MNTLCIYHNDTDGRTSAAIVRRSLGRDVVMCEMKYGDSFPLDEVLVADHIIIVDFSLPREDMQRLAAYHQFTWIDHHQSAIEEMSDISEDWPGTRQTNEAACVLTWRYFFPDKPIPRAVVLIGDRDIWRWDERETGAFNEGLYQLNTNPYNTKLWKPLLDDDRVLVKEIIERGSILREARLRNIQSATARYGFVVIFEGHRTLAVNLRGSGDLGEHIRNCGHEIAYCYIDNLVDGELYTFVSLYSNEVDVAKIAQRFGGGGHRGAAGFHFKRESAPFPAEADVIYPGT
jgi:oligoribonuclease NrnB/cAMP/cGMP phosphodiesterase (DHH superfamily)